MSEAGRGGSGAEFTLPSWAACFPADYSRGRRIVIKGVQLGPVLLGRGNIFLLEERAEVGSVRCKKTRYGKPFLTIDGLEFSGREPVDEFVEKIIQLRGWLGEAAERLWTFYPVMIFPGDAFVHVHYKERIQPRRISVINERFLPNLLDILTCNASRWGKIPDDEMDKLASALERMTTTSTRT